jgi:hypothetical protein
MKKSLITLSITIAVLVIVFIVYKVIMPIIRPCESIFQQTSLRLSSKLDIIKSKGPEVSIEEQKIQDLTERSQIVALNLKTCCIVLEGGKVDSEQFLRCKDNAEKFETQVDKVATNIDEAQSAKQQGKTELVNEKVSQINQTIDVAKTSSEELSKKVTELKATQPKEKPGNEESSSGSEQEPNNTIFEANPFLIGATVSGEISGPDDTDFFKFHNNSKLRDIVKVNLENQSTTLQPDINVYDSNKSGLFDRYNYTSGANLEFDFVAEPGKDYYFRVSGASGTSGKYKLSVKTQKAYDEYEPNDDAFSATPIKIGQTIEANIMDSADVDWYKVTGIIGKKIIVRFENQSTTLQPDINVYDSNKSGLFDRYNYTSGADLDFDFVAEPGKDYYFRVSGASGTSGKYKLIVNQE